MTAVTTQMINALRGHMTEYGWIAPQGPSHMARLAELIEDPLAVSEPVRAICRLLLDNLAMLDRQIAVLDKETARRAREDEVARRLMTIPGIEPITATAITPQQGSIFHADSQTTMRSAPNRRWSLNVLSDAFACRRRLRMPSEVDDLKRKCLALVADMSLSGVRVVRKLDGLLAADGRER